QDVFPPYLTVSGPGDGSEPRHPQMRARTSGVPGRVGVLVDPEDRGGADEVLAPGEQRERGHTDLDLVLVALDPDGLVDGPLLVERDRDRQIGRLHRMTVHVG